MGFRFRRSKKIAPGLRVNFSKSGPSLTVGGKHVRTTFGHGRVTRSVRTPIKGLYYSETTSKGKTRKSGAKRKSSTNTSGGALGCLGSLIALGGIFAIGIFVLYLVIIAALLFIAFTYYRANKMLTPDRVERMGSIMYPNEPEKKIGAWSIYLKNKSMLNSLPKDIASLENKANSFNSEDISLLFNILNEREQKQWQYQALLEIAAEPDFYEPVYDDFSVTAFKSYIDRTFAPVFADAESLKTERGKKNRYIKYLDRFKDCYDQLPESALEILDGFMAEHGIQFSSNDTEEQGGEYDVRMS
jgi:hypothetical protein